MKILNEKTRPFIGLTINVAFGIVHCTVGFLYQSWWFITLITKRHSNSE